mmetsp:Transcript_45615/g.67259  ORF Transcript_45615/g.67259 Transcript_45615/m.67259 type:complete len:135 (-) Transcript_45615:240-644(-)
MSSNRKNTHQQVFLRQATILRTNLYKWDRQITSTLGEDWPTMLGRLNAALNQCGNLDDGIDDVLEHFVYVPKKAVANPQDIPVFLSSRLASELNEEDRNSLNNAEAGDTVKVVQQYEKSCAELAAKFEDSIVRF